MLAQCTVRQRSGFGSAASEQPSLRATTEPTICITQAPMLPWGQLECRGLIWVPDGDAACVGGQKGSGGAGVEPPVGERPLLSGGLESPLLSNMARRFLTWLMATMVDVASSQGPANSVPDDA